uniref:uncharacterized protein LOC120338849 n=1 Tax=Styela clava TaxID=7725 RepID=UPI00193AC7B5|nr:uncharacterized protein LOC120338849 [Styela clava]
MKKLFKHLAIVIFATTMLMLVAMQIYLNTDKENRLFLQIRNDHYEERNFIKKDYNTENNDENEDQETTSESNDISESTVQDEKLMEKYTEKQEKAKEYTRKYTSTEIPTEGYGDKIVADSNEEVTIEPDSIDNASEQKPIYRSYESEPPETENRSKSQESESPKRANAESNKLSICPEYSKLLVGPLQVNASYSPTEDEAMKSGGTMENGCFEPTWCVARQTVAIIIPYKDRKEHLITLMNHLNPILQRQSLRYCIFVAEQFDNGAFNKARVMNAAFLEIIKFSKINFDCVIFHDVDMLVEDDRNLHTCSKMPKHLSPAIDKFNYTLNYGTRFGGVTAISVKNYIKANGHSNNFWGWGGEDNDMEMRIARNKMVIVSTNTTYGRYKMIPHEHPWWFSPLYGIGSYLHSRRHWSVKGIDNSGLGDIRYSLKFSSQHKLWTKMTIDIRTILVEKATVRFYGYGDVGDLEFTSPSQETEKGTQMSPITPAPMNCFYRKFTGKTVNKTLGIREKVKYGRMYKTLEEAEKVCNEMQSYCGSIVEQMPGRYSLRSTAFMHEKNLHYLKGMVKQEEVIENHPTLSVHAKSCPGSASYLNFFVKPIVMVGDAEKGPSPAYFVEFRIKIFYDINTTLYYNSDIMTAHRAIIQEKVHANIEEMGTWDTLGNVYSNRVKLLNTSDAASVAKIMPKTYKNMNEVVKNGDGILHIKSPITGILRNPGCYVCKGSLVDVNGAALLQWKWWFEIRAKTKEIEDEILVKQLKKARKAGVEFAETVNKRRQMWLQYHEKLKEKGGNIKSKLPDRVLELVRKESLQPEH